MGTVAQRRVAPVPDADPVLGVEDFRTRGSQALCPGLWIPCVGGQGSSRCPSILAEDPGRAPFPSDPPLPPHLLLLQPPGPEPVWEGQRRFWKADMDGIHMHRRGFGVCCLETPSALLPRKQGWERTSAPEFQGLPTLSTLGGPPHYSRGSQGHRDVGKMAAQPLLGSGSRDRLLVPWGQVALIDEQHPSMSPVCWTPLGSFSHKESQSFCYHCYLSGPASVPCAIDKSNFSSPGSPAEDGRWPLLGGTPGLAPQLLTGCLESGRAWSS